MLIYLVVAGTTNAVNLTDGLDGLAAGCAAIVLLAYIGITFITAGPAATSRCCRGCLVGACVGFLWFNAFPATIFMGDTGSLGLGGAIAGLAVMTKTEVLLILLGGIFVIEALSVLIQVFSFQTFRKRVFLMAPIHHHFELMAWSETKIILRFWIVAAICAAIGFTIYQAVDRRDPSPPLPPRALPRRRPRALRAWPPRALLRARGEEVLGVDAGRARRGEPASRPSSATRRPRAARRARARVVKSPGRAGARRRSIAAARERGHAGDGRARAGLAAARRQRFIAVTGHERQDDDGRAARRRSTARPGVPVAVAGNVGHGRYASLVGAARPGRASSSARRRSFQLEDTLAFAPEAAVLLNLEPDHLDRHGTLRGLPRRPSCRPSPARARRRRRRARLGIDARRRGARSARSPLAIRDGALRGTSRERTSPPARRRTTARNARRRPRPSRWPAASTRRRRARRCATFAGVAHRLEEVAERDGVLYVNDSKATNVASTLVALARVRRRRVHLILGGQGKGQDFAPLRDAGRGALRVACYLIGEAAGAARARRVGHRRSTAATSSTRSPRRAPRPRPGDVVLLSPACASFDQFARLRGARRALQGAGARAAEAPAARRSAPGWPPPQPRRKRRSSTSILLTATLCLLAAGAVMVYSASLGARRCSQGQGDGTAYLVQVPACTARSASSSCRSSRAAASSSCAALTPAAARRSRFVLLRRGEAARASAWRSTARAAGSAPARCSSSPRELMKLALVLYAARAAGRQAASGVQTLKGLVSPLLLVAGAAALLIASQPDLGTALVIGFTIVGAARRGGHADAPPGDRSARPSRGLIFLFALLEPYRRARLTSFLDPWAHAGDAGFQAVQGQIALGSGGLLRRAAWASRCRRSSTCPRPTRTSSWRSSARSWASSGSAALLFLYGLIAYAGLRAAKARAGRLRAAARGRDHLADPLPGAAERLHGARPRAADRRAAAVHLLRLART